MVKRGSTGRRVVGIVIVAILVITLGVAAAFGYLRFPPDSYEAMDSTDRAAFDVLSAQYEAFRDHPDELWTDDYAYQSKPLMLVRAPDAENARIPGYQYAFVVNGGEAVRTLLGAVPVRFPDEMGLDDVVATKWLGSETLPSSAPVNFANVELGGTTTLMFRFNADRMERPQPGLEFPLFVLHEAFHTYKQAGWTFDARDPNRPWGAVRSPEEIDGLRIEARILDAAAASDPATTTHDEYFRLARDLVAVRLARIEESPLVAAQANVEAIEGTARYLESRYEELVAGSAGAASDGDDVPDAAVATFVSVVDAAAKDPEGSAQVLDYGLYYDTGAQLCYILDQVAPDWKTLIEPSPVGGGLTPFDILQRAVGPVEVPTREQLTEIGASYGS